MVDQFDKVLPYGVGVAAVVFVVIFLLAAYFSELMKGFASRTSDLELVSRGELGELLVAGQGCRESEEGEEVVPFS
ncbi:hypothetical protein, partial [Streptomyces malaysiensis]|uniref:hypothetical protein n=1 Tax=Streptomyces malaysiensis TaxID=92644 RepID=UPI00371DFBCE